MFSFLAKVPEPSRYKAHASFTVDILEELSTSREENLRVSNGATGVMMGRLRAVSHRPWSFATTWCFSWAVSGVRLETLVYRVIS
jgi:hypothetical protein